MKAVLKKLLFALLFPEPQKDLFDLGKGFA